MTPLDIETLETRYVALQQRFEDVGAALRHFVREVEALRTRVEVVLAARPQDEALRKAIEQAWR